MTASLLLDNDVHCPPNNFVHATPFSTTLHHLSTSDGSESDASIECDHEHDHEQQKEPRPSPGSEAFFKGPLVGSEWTGTPIRAIIPLPRRKLVTALNGTTKRSVDTTRSASTSVPSSWVGGQSRVWAPRDDLDSDSEDEGDEDEDDAEGVVMGRADCCSYESITAAQGLAAWSFEELRVECYAQSLVARGTKPPPVVQPSLAIPPAFVPRIVRRDLDPTFVTTCK